MHGQKCSIIFDRVKSAPRSSSYTCATIHEKCQPKKSIAGRATREAESTGESISLEKHKDKIRRVHQKYLLKVTNSKSIESENKDKN